MPPEVIDLVDTASAAAPPASDSPSEASEATSSPPPLPIMPFSPFTPGGSAQPETVVRLSMEVRSPWERGLGPNPMGSAFSFLAAVARPSEQSTSSRSTLEDMPNPFVREPNAAERRRLSRAHLQPR